MPLQTGLAGSSQSALARHSTQEVPFLHISRAPLQAGLVPHIHCWFTHALAVIALHAVEQLPQCVKSVAMFTHIATFLQQLEFVAP